MQAEIIVHAENPGEFLGGAFPVFHIVLLPFDVFPLRAENTIDIIGLVILGNDRAVAVVDVAPQRLGGFAHGVGRIGITAQVRAGAQMDFPDGNQKNISRKDQHRS